VSIWARNSSFARGPQLPDIREHPLSYIPEPPLSHVSACSRSFAFRPAVR